MMLKDLLPLLDMETISIIVSLENDMISGGSGTVAEAAALYDNARITAIEEAENGILIYLDAREGEP